MKWRHIIVYLVLAGFSGCSGCGGCGGCGGCHNEINYYNESNQGVHVGIESKNNPHLLWMPVAAGRENMIGASYEWGTMKVKFSCLRKNPFVLEPIYVHDFGDIDEDIKGRARAYHVDTTTHVVDSTMGYVEFTYKIFEKPSVENEIRIKSVTKKICPW